MDADKIVRWLTKIGVELAAATGMTDEESALFVDANRGLIAERFANRTARADVVQELQELLKSARAILAAE